MKCDGEPAAKAVQKDLIARRPPPRRTIPVNPPAYDPLANGNIEAGVRDLNIQMRNQKIGLQKQLRRSLSAKHPVVELLLQHSAFIYNRFVVHADGKTCYERMHGRRWRGK